MLLCMSLFLARTDRPRCSRGDVRCYGASGDDIASIGGLLTEDGSIGADVNSRQWSPSMRKPNRQDKPLNDLSSFTYTARR